MFNANLDATVDDLEQGLLAREALISQMRQQQAALLSSLDAMQVNQLDGARFLQEWTRARLDVSAHTARDLVDAARSLPERPYLVELAQENGLSFERLVATCRLVQTGADDETVARSFGFDLAGVARFGNRHRRISHSGEHDVFVDRHIWTQNSFDGSRGRFGGELPGFEFGILSKALGERADMFGDLPGPRTTKPQRLADALVSIAQDSLEMKVADGTPSLRSEPTTVVLVDGRVAADTHGQAGAEIEYGPRVGPAVLERILCGGRVQLIGMINGKPAAAGNATRAISPAIRRFVAWRDGGCTIAGCHSRYRLQPHHIRPFADGGTHDPDNLTTLCWFHHHVVAHRMGMRLDPDSPPGRRRFLRNHATGSDPPRAYQHR